MEYYSFILLGVNQCLRVDLPHFFETKFTRLLVKLVDQQTKKLASVKFCTI